MQLIKDQLQQLLYTYSGAIEVTKSDFTWYGFSDDWIWDIVPRHITLGYTFLDKDRDISSLSDNFLAFNLLADDPYK